jgi:hypothetical protein
MFFARRSAILGLGLMLAAASTEAREFELSLESRMTGENNVFRTSDNPSSDGFFTLAPRVAVRENNSVLNYDFSYRPTYETYFDTSGIDGFNHSVQGVLGWRPTSTDTFGLNGSFTDRRSLRLEQEVGGVSGSPLVESDRQRLERSNASLSYRRNLNDAFSLQASASFEDLAYSDDTSVDSRSFSGTAGLQYAMSPITITGLSLTLREIRSRPGFALQPETDTEIWNLAASVERALTPTLNLSLQAGPSFIETKRRAQVSFGSDMDSQTTSYFAAASLEKTWKRAELSGSYTRSESSGGGSTSTSISDVVTLEFTHSITRQWSYRFYGTWLQSEEISASTLSGKRKTTQYRAFVSVTHRVSRQLSVVGQVSYFSQDENEAFNSDSIGGVYSGYLALRYTFDPVVF